MPGLVLQVPGGTGNCTLHTLDLRACGLGQPVDGVVRTLLARGLIVEVGTEPYVDAFTTT